MAINASAIPQSLVNALANVPPSTPLTLVNLLRFRTTAAYAGKDSSTGTGAEAYDRYIADLLPAVERAKGRVIQYGNVAATLFAPQNEQWDAVLMIEYPSLEHFLQLLEDPQYIGAVPHREAALADTRALGLCAKVLPARA